MSALDLSELRKAVALHDDARTLKRVSTDWGRIITIPISMAALNPIL